MPEVDRRHFIAALGAGSVMPITKEKVLFPSPDWPMIAIFQKEDVPGVTFVPSDVWEPWGIATTRFRGQAWTAGISLKKDPAATAWALPIMIYMARISLLDLPNRRR